MLETTFLAFNVAETQYTSCSHDTFVEVVNFDLSNISIVTGAAFSNIACG